MKSTILACWLLAATSTAYASDPLAENTIEFLRLLGMELQGTNSAVSNWTVPNLPISFPDCSGRFSGSSGANGYSLELTNSLGRIVSSIDLVAYPSSDDALIGLAFSIGGSSSALLSRIAADTIVSTNQIGIIEFCRTTTNPQRGFSRKWFLFRNITFSFRNYSEFDAETATAIILRAGGVDIPDEPLRSSPSSSPPASEPFQEMRVFSAGPEDDSTSPAQDSGQESTTNSNRDEIVPR